MSDLHAAGKAFQDARDAQKLAAARLQIAIREAIAKGMSEKQAAKVAGIDRGTVRRALGKSRGQKTIAPKTQVSTN